MVMSGMHKTLDISTHNQLALWADPVSLTFIGVFCLFDLTMQ